MSELEELDALTVSEDDMDPGAPGPAQRRARSRRNHRTNASKVNIPGAKKAVKNTVVDGGRPPRVHGNTKHPWDEMRLAYVEGVPDGNHNISYPSQDWVATQYGVSLSQVQQRSAAEKWTERRDQHKAAHAAQRRRERQVELAQLSSDIDNRAANMSKAGLAIAAARLGEIGKDMTVRQEWIKRRDQALLNNTTPPTGDEPRTIDSRELETLARAANTWLDLGRKALGDDVTRIEVTGSEGGPITHVQSHLVRDDPNRLAEMAVAMQRAGLLPSTLAAQTVDGEVEVKALGQAPEGTVEGPQPYVEASEKLGNLPAEELLAPDPPPVPDVDPALFTKDNGYDIED